MGCKSYSPDKNGLALDASYTGIIAGNFEAN